MFERLTNLSMQGIERAAQPFVNFYLVEIEQVDVLN